MREIKDLIDYLTEIEYLAYKLDGKQKEDLRQVIKTILTLLVALKKSSNLGRQGINFKP